MYQTVIDANTKAAIEIMPNQSMKKENTPLINPTIIEQTSTFLVVNRWSCSSSLLVVIIIVSMLTPDNASILAFLLLLTISHMPPPIPIIMIPITMKIVLKPNVVRSPMFSVSRI